VKSDSSTSSAGSEASGEDLNSSEDIGASGPVTTTNTPTRSTPSTSGKRTIIQATLGKSKPAASPITIFSVLDFLARRSVSLERGRGLETLVERYSSRLPALRGLKDPLYCSLKTLRASSTTMKDLRSRSSSNRWRNWGILSNGRCLTANISGFPRTGNGCSLSDILETEVPDQYFLSQSQTQYLLKNLEDGKESHLVLTPTTIREQVDNEPSLSILSTKRRDRT